MAAWKVWNFRKTTVHHFVLSGKTNFLTILYKLRAMHGILPKVVEIIISSSTIIYCAKGAPTYYEIRYTALHYLYQLL
jgi:hypothetical protein